MKKKEGCYYCEQNENFRSLLFRICDLKASTVFLCRDQTLPGRCTIMFKDHNDESFQIPKEEREEFVDDMCALAETIRELFGADKEKYRKFKQASAGVGNRDKKRNVRKK